MYDIFSSLKQLKSTLLCGSKSVYTYILKYICILQRITKWVQSERSWQQSHEHDTLWMKSVMPPVRVWIYIHIYTAYMYTEDHVLGCFDVTIVYAVSYAYSLVKFWFYIHSTLRRPTKLFFLSKKMCNVCISSFWDMVYFVLKLL